MSSLSDLFKKHGKASNADIEWLHLLLSDWQLVADLVFADLVLWIPTSEGSFVAAGHARPSSAATTFFRDIADAALECDAEIHKYVGDEAILTWPAGQALADGDCLACPFAARDRIAASSALYLERFGAVPEFRAALHCGEIVAGEIGDLRREIAYVGDTLNVAARLLEAAKTRGRDILVSADLLKSMPLPSRTG